MKGGIFFWGQKWNNLIILYWSAVWDGFRYLTTQTQVECYNCIVYYGHYLVIVVKLKLIMAQ